MFASSEITSSFRLSSRSESTAMAAHCERELTRTFSAQSREAVKERLHVSLFERLMAQRCELFCLRSPESSD